ncbi:pilus assembly PilX family protein [Xanthomonas nasturtii]|uniref:pilus assembly PilX family protein n=1 Tax=Xanthomonas nasturtii TaxID=1843581 RepID=UPI0020133A41|nr:PilX N-terminal domain-containing pilus assembly protein [Xanthomonas nasturtii]MCL1499896.1 PilX N-terminal domain-containing pilus assembly protein [Xanthomonas nasturtii]MCL1503584.1 PilX N-terminal domain-containing pilus assembly protein [Xanthomonas nasturtii]MCL1523469.1 PilX N-terminal domain-containing pilus assembly protein [Xanthomonas nasturtii]
MATNPSGNGAISARGALRRRYTQSGAVLYVALIMLILLALLGIAGMQVTGLQERMAFNYRSSNVAFQNAEQLARSTECGIENAVNRTSNAGCAVVTDVKECAQPFDPTGWAMSLKPSNGPGSNVRLLGPCISGNSSLGMGEPVNEDPNPVYQITAYNADGADGDAADAAVDTIFRP